MYLGSTKSDEGSRSEVLSLTANIRCSYKLIWNDKKNVTPLQDGITTFPCPVNIPVYLTDMDPDSWTEALEMGYLNISYKDPIPDEVICIRVLANVSLFELLLITVKTRMLRCMDMSFACEI